MSAYNKIKSHPFVRFIYHHHQHSTASHITHNQRSFNKKRTLSCFMGIISSSPTFLYFLPLPPELDWNPLLDGQRLTAATRWSDEWRECGLVSVTTCWAFHRKRTLALLWSVHDTLLDRPRVNDEEDRRKEQQHFQHFFLIHWCTDTSSHHQLHIPSDTDQHPESCPI